MTIRDHSDVEDIEDLRSLMQEYQKVGYELNKRVQEGKYRLSTANKRIERMKELYHLRLSSLIEEAK